MGQWTTKPSKVDDYKPFLRQRWDEGERNATHPERLDEQQRLQLKRS